MDREAVRIGLGWNRQRQSQLESLGDPTLVAARVAALHRGSYGLVGSEVDSARPAGRFRAEGGEWPAVGDWVAVQPAAGEGVIQHILPRTSLLTRRRPLLQQPQAVAANVDVVFVVTSAEQPPNLRKVERYLAVVWASGARPVVVLNKADLSADLAADLQVLQSATAGLSCLGTSAVTGTGLPELRAQLATGHTGAMVGPSGVGKSSLLNALRGPDSVQLATSAVRARDGKGRHTTTRRELHELPGGGCLIDTPGMRELGLWEAGPGIEQAFGEVESLAAGCRFRDCRHQGEPGCAVQAALETGALDPARLASFDKLRREQAFHERQQDPRRATASKGRWKVIHKQIRARRRVDPKLRED